MLQRFMGSLTGTSMSRVVVVFSSSPSVDPFDMMLPDTISSTEKSRETFSPLQSSRWHSTSTIVFCKLQDACAAFSAVSETMSPSRIAVTYTPYWARWILGEKVIDVVL